MKTVPWATIAARSGYYDQAHLAHEARAIAGTAPSELLVASGGLTEIFLASESSG